MQKFGVAPVVMVLILLLLAITAALSVVVLTSQNNRSSPTWPYNAGQRGPGVPPPSNGTVTPPPAGSECVGDCSGFVWGNYTYYYKKCSSFLGKGFAKILGKDRTDPIIISGECCYPVGAYELSTLNITSADLQNVRQVTEAAIDTEDECQDDCLFVDTEYAFCDAIPSRLSGCEACVDSCENCDALSCPDEKGCSREKYEECTRVRGSTLDYCTYDYGVSPMLSVDRCKAEAIGCCNLHSDEQDCRDSYDACADRCDSEEGSCAENADSDCLGNARCRCPGYNECGALRCECISACVSNLIDCFQLDM